ncbi:MAG TPA: hypothetical protein VMR43_05600 [Variovorax sp.]|nr:hypothetical protein [Variovorax sp.]
MVIVSVLSNARTSHDLSGNVLLVGHVRRGGFVVGRRQQALGVDWRPAFLSGALLESIGPFSGQPDSARKPGHNTRHLLKTVLSQFLMSARKDESTKRLVGLLRRVLWAAV